MKKIPGLPPGGSCFPKMAAVREMKKVRPQKGEKVPADGWWRPVLATDLHSDNELHAVRWVQQFVMLEMTPTAFKKEYGYRKTMAKIYELIAEAEGSGVGPETIKKSCDLVDAAIKAGKGWQFFVVDTLPRKLGKKRHHPG